MLTDGKPLKDKVFVFTGTMSIDRDDAKVQVISLGGRCTTMLSSRTTFLVVGTEPGLSKIQKAKHLGAKILSENEFLVMIKESSERFKGRAETSVESNAGEKVILAIDKGEKNGGKDLIWSEKYRPKSKSEIIGNIGLMRQLEEYILGKTKYKAALLSGPPGIGKTTAAHLICKSLGYNIVEFNSSDVRSKSELDDRIGNVINSRSISGGVLKKRVLIMDEIDGMAGDKGGVPELINIIKKALVPIICICNDRNDQKIRTLSNHCLDLRFRRPEARSILPRMKHILHEEKRQIPDELINELLVKGGGDIRYMLNTMQNMALKKSDGSRRINEFVKKNIMKNVFDVAVEIFQKRSVSEKIDLYFHDYTLIPLFVSENFLKLSFNSTKDFYKRCDVVSLGDIVEKSIRGSDQEWSLAPLHAVYSAVMPTFGKTLTKRMDFPSWLGQNSKHSKFKRTLGLISIFSSSKIRMNQSELRKYGFEAIFKRYVDLLMKEEIGSAVEDMVDHGLTKENMAEICEFVYEGTELFRKIGRKAKIALDKEYRKLNIKHPHVVDVGDDEYEDFNEENNGLVEEIY